MAKGDIFEPIFEFSARIFFPRVGSSSIVDELSWPWFACLILVGAAYISLRTIFSEVEAKLGEDVTEEIRNSSRFCRIALWCVLFLSLFMFRFATSF